MTNTLSSDALINGVAHVMLTVSQEDWDECKQFYAAFCSFVGMHNVFDTDEWLYYVGCRMALGIRKSPSHKATKFDQEAPGLHHVCLRCYTKEGVDEIHGFLVFLKRKFSSLQIIRQPEEGPWANGYYSILWECPAGIRLECNYVPGKGLLADAKPKLKASL